MSTLKILLLDKRLNTSGLAAYLYPTLPRTQAAGIYNKLLKRKADLPADIIRDARALARTIKKSLDNEEAMLRLAADDRLNTRSVATAIWPTPSADAAYQALRNRCRNKAIVGDERKRLRAWLETLLGELELALNVPH